MSRALSDLGRMRKKASVTELAVNLRGKTNLGWGCAADGMDADYLR